MSFLSLKSRDIGIDLGTANILVTLNGKGIVYREPAVIAIENQTGNVIAIGNEAKEMLGRTPKEVSAIRPLKDGVIADFTATKLLLKKIMDKVCKKYNAVRPRVIVGVPSGITEVEERAVEETIIRAGAKEVYLIEEPMAAAIGAGIEIEQPSGNIIVDIGGGTTEVAVISLGGIVLSNSIRVAGDELNEDIINYVKRELNLAIGETTAENIKKELGCALPLMSQMSMKIKDDFVLRKVADSYVVVPVNSLTLDFNGVINLNETGAFLFEQLQKGIEKDELIAKMISEYDVTKEKASANS